MQKLRRPHPYLYPGLSSSFDISDISLAPSFLAEYSPEQIIDRVARVYEVDVDKMLSRNRRREVVIPRQIAQYLVFYVCKLTVTDTGRIFRLDHTTVLHSIRTVKEQFAVDKTYRTKFFELLDA